MGSEVKSLSEPVLLILTSLAGQPRHGYALLQDVEKLSGQRFEDFARSRLFAPLGITELSWTKMPNGVVGTPAHLERWAGIDPPSVAQRVMKLLSNSRKEP